MAKKPSFLIGLLGLFCILLGFNMIISGIYYALIAAILGIFGITISLLSTLGLLGIIVGIPVVYVGFKLYFDNENSLLKGLLGVVGIVLFFFGIIAAFLGVITWGISLFAALLLWSFSLAFVAYGFGIDGLKFLSKLIEAIKKLVR